MHLGNGLDKLWLLPALEDQMPAPGHVGAGEVGPKMCATALCAQQRARDDQPGGQRGVGGGDRIRLAATRLAGESIEAAQRSLRPSAERISPACSRIRPASSLRQLVGDWRFEIGDWP